MWKSHSLLMEYSWTPTASTHCIRITMQDDQSVTRECNKMESVTYTHLSYRFLSWICHFSSRFTPQGFYCSVQVGIFFMKACCRVGFTVHSQLLSVCQCQRWDDFAGSILREIEVSSLFWGKIPIGGFIASVNLQLQHN